MNGNQGKKLYWRALVIILLLLLFSSVCASLFSFYPFYKESKLTLEHNYENSLVEHAYTMKLYFSRLSDTANQVSSRTRASLLLESLEKQENPKKKQELKKILNAALKSSNLVVGIQRYSPSGKLVAAVGKNYPTYTPSFAVRFLRIIPYHHEYLAQKITAINSQTGSDNIIGYDVIYFSIKPLVAILDDIKTLPDTGFVWTYFNGKRWRNVYASSNKEIQLSNAINIAEKKSKKRGIAKVEGDNNIYYIMSIGENMVLATQIRASKIFYLVMSKIYIVPILIILWIIVAGIIIGLLLRSILKNIFLESVEGPLREFKAPLENLLEMTKRFLENEKEHLTDQQTKELRAMQNTSRQLFALIDDTCAKEKTLFREKT